MATFLNSAAGLEDKITCSSKTGDVYKGKGSGGGSIPQQCLKVGKASGGGGFTFAIPETYNKVDRVEITCYGWKTTSSISINSGTAQTFNSAQVVATKTFDLTQSVREFTISVTTSAVCITSIVLKEKAASGPTLSVDPTTAAAFTYEVGEGPSDDQMFEITGSNLTESITASLTGDYEMTDDSEYGTGNLTLSSGEIISVRLKAGLDKGEHNGTLTFASEGATSVVINLTGTVTKSDPSITADDVNLAYGATSGAITYTVAHGVEGGVLTAALTEASDWLTVGTASASAVALTSTVNKGDVRTATVRLTYTYDTDKTVTKDVTVTQASPLVDAWVETDFADLANIDDVFVIVGDNGSTYALPNDANTSGAPSVVAVTVVDGKLSGDIASNLQWTRKGSSSAGYEFYPNGTDQRYLYCIEQNNGVRVGTGDYYKYEIKDGYLYHKQYGRYLGIYNSQDWRCYTSHSGTNNNIADQTFKFYKKVKVSSINIADACTDGAKYYGTYSSSSAFIVPSDLTVSEIKVESGKLALSNYSTGEVVPANTGVMVAATTSGSHDVIVSTGGTSKLGVNNMLIATGDDGVTASDMSDEDYYYYRLTMADSKPGFWWKSEKGAGFDLAANKAYLKVLKTEAVAARGFWFDFDNETTGITDNKRETTNSHEYFNLAGQRVAQPTKGLYIVNGNKVVIR